MADDVRRRNLGASKRPRDDRGSSDGPRKMRLTDKPATKYTDIASDAQAALAARLHIRNESDWLERGQTPCPLCKTADHYLWHCVKVWAATAAGQKWLGSAKAAEFASRLRDAAAVLTVGEFVAAFEDDYGQSSQAARDMLLDGMCFMCDLCDVDVADDAAPAEPMLLVAQTLSRCDFASLVADDAVELQ